jgi:hypothetical protein
MPGIMRNIKRENKSLPSWELCNLGKTGLEWSKPVPNKETVGCVFFGSPEYTGGCGINDYLVILFLW